AGEAIEELGVDERATMTNMAAEIGGFTGIVAPDKKAVDFLVERRGMDRKKAEAMIEGLYSDKDAQYAHVIELDAAEITPMVATPGDPGNGKYVRDLNTPVPVEIAYGGTCTAGKNEDMDMYAAVLANALKQGKRVADSVKFYIQFGSQETREYCVRKGYLDVFREAGAIVIEPSCGACINAGPGVSTRPDQVVISAQNRNFRAQRPGPNVSGESADRGRQRCRGLHRGIRTGKPARASQRGVTRQFETHMWCLYGCIGVPSAALGAGSSTPVRPLT